MEETRNSYALQAGDTLMADVLGSSQSRRREDGIPFHRLKKSLDDGLPSKHLFPELTSLVPVLLDSEDEESANVVDEEIIKSHLISAGDKDILLSGLKANKSKPGGFFGQLFSKKRCGKKDKDKGPCIARKDRAAKVLHPQAQLFFDDVSHDNGNDRKKILAERHTSLILSCFGKH